MLYDIGFLMFSIVYLPVLLFKGKLHKDFPERFGIYDAKKLSALSSSRSCIWIQAVSVGEVVLCKNLIFSLRERFPDKKIIISTITKTGNDLAKKIFSENATIFFFPLDISFIVKKVLRLIQPRLYIMVETEIWPNLLKELDRQDIPAVIINGRISDRSFGKYRLAKLFLKNTLFRIKAFCMQSAIDGERILALGAPADRVKVTGNMKFDIGIKTESQASDSIKRSLGLAPGEELFVAGSTHRDEEAMLLKVFAAVVREFPRTRLLIAPRHIDRAGEIEALIQHLKFTPFRASSQFVSGWRWGEANEVCILDSIGRLSDIYAAAELVFIGGSMVPYGGHNPIEPAAYAKPIIFGPHMFNFKNIADIFLKNNAVLQIRSEDDLLEKVRLLLRDDAIRSQLGRHALEVVNGQRGATQKNIETISGFLR